jgi:antitoxin CptB
VEGVRCDPSSPGSRRRLRWRCRRGLLELDVWLGKFADAALEQLTGAEEILLESMLEEADMSLLDWLEGRQTPPVAYAGLVARIRASV